jgi:NAD(P)-dependent dehydrogenase (short-subunit alcohol dehydrogenase family)
MAGVDTTAGQEQHDHADRAVLITGASSGFGESAAAQFAEHGFARVTLHGRSHDRVEEARVRIAGDLSGDTQFSEVLFDVSDLDAVRGGAAELEKLVAGGPKYSVVVLNAGLTAEDLKLSAQGYEMTLAASLLGHHVLVVELLTRDLLTADAHILLAGSEGARGNMMGAQHFPYQDMKKSDVGLQGELEKYARGELPKPYVGMDTYINVKLWSAWWAAAFARRLKAEHQSVVCVSPGFAMGTGFSRNMGFFARHMFPLIAKIGPWLGMSASVKTGAHRYLEAADLPESESGHFYASEDHDKVFGRLADQQDEIFFDQELQEAIWALVGKLTGSVDE